MLKKQKEDKMDTFINLVEKQIREYEKKTDFVEELGRGKIVTLGDGIALVYGLSEVMYGEMVEFSQGVLGIIVGLEEGIAEVIVLGDDLLLKEGDEVKRTRKLANISFSTSLAGKVVDALGNILNLPLSGHMEEEETGEKKTVFIENDAPGIIQRKAVKRQLYTG